MCHGTCPLWWIRPCIRIRTRTLDFFSFLDVTHSSGANLKLVELSVYLNLMVAQFGQAIWLIDGASLILDNGSSSHDSVRSSLMIFLEKHQTPRFLNVIKASVNIFSSTSHQVAGTFPLLIHMSPRSNQVCCIVLDILSLVRYVSTSQGCRMSVIIGRKHKNQNQNYFILSAYSSYDIQLQY